MLGDLELLFCAFELGYYSDGAAAVVVLVIFYTTDVALPEILPSTILLQ